MKKLKKFTHQRFQSLIDHLRSHKDKQEEQSLHDIRIDIKKIKSILELLKFVDKKFKAHRNYVLFRTIFRKAGELRDPEIQAGLLLRYNIEGVRVKNDYHAKKSTFLAATNKFEKQIIEQQKKIGPFIQQVTNHDVKSFFKEKNKQIKKALTTKPDLTEIHKIRKAMKLVIYLADLNKSAKRKLLNFYHKMEQAIGDLHDKQVVLGLVTHESKRKIDPSARKVILAECRDSISEIRKEAKKFYRNHKHAV